MTKLTLCLVPFAAALVPLFWFTFGHGDEWAHSLFNTEHPLNLGGNPSEVFSHLLNGIVMAVCVSSLCLLLLVTLWGQQPQPENRLGTKLDPVLLATSLASMLATWLWAAFLDFRSGEGTVVMAFFLFFAPAVALSGVFGRGLIYPCAACFSRALAVLFLWAVSLGMIWIYEPSGTGGPNILVIPLLAVQVGLFWYASRTVRKAASTREESGII